MYWNNTKPLAGMDGWVSDFCPWYGYISRVNRGLKPWVGVGESEAAQILPARIRSHMCVDKNAPWMGPHLKRKLVTIFGRGIGQESSK